MKAVGFGRPAAELLADQVREAKAGDALAPVTIVVPTHYLGVATRRQLASTGSGVAGVTFTTIHRLAELIAAPVLAGASRKPVSAPVIAAAIRGVLREEPGMFAPVATHPATEEALTSAYRELSAVTDTGRRALAGVGPRAADVVRICNAAKRQLEPGWFDEHDLVAEAAGTVERRDLNITLGPVIAHLPERVTPAEASFLKALAANDRVVINVGLTGERRADEALDDHLARLGVAVPDASSIKRPSVARIVSTTDPDEEVRAAVRLLVDEMRAGRPLGRMAIVYGTPQPYAELLHEHLAAAGIPRNGVAVNRVADSLAGRVLRSLLALPDNRYRRRDVLGLLATAPIRDPDSGARLPSRAWERVSRKAAVVDGDDWDLRLPLLADDLRFRAKEAAAEGKHGVELGRESEAARADALAAFVRRLRTDLERAGRLSSWADMSGWAAEMLARYLGAEDKQHGWPEDERRAAERVDAALDRLASLDALDGGGPSVEVFRRTLEAELETSLPRVGRLGDGVLVGHVSVATGLTLDTVVVLGLAEGSFPARRLEDSLLPDREREVTNGELALRMERVHEDHRRLLAAIAGAERAVISYPRGDLRRPGDRPASRWLLAEASRLAGRPLFTQDLHDLRHEPWFTEVPSFAGGLTQLSFPATRQEYGVRSLAAHADAVDVHPLVAGDTVLRRGVALARARRSSQFTRFDGNLADAGVISPVALGRPVSPTSLEKWATCPHRYLFDHILHVEVVEDPDRALEMSALDKGTLVHKILEDFIQRAVDKGAPAGPWSDEHRRWLREIAEHHCLDAEARGTVGRALFWRRDKGRIIADLERFLEKDSEERMARAAVPIAAEMKFDDAAIVLDDGRRVRFHGQADRVDRTHHGDLVVIDYKTGSSRDFKGLNENDPHKRGTKLQLAVYGEAARSAYGDADTPVHATYWFITTKGGFECVGYDVTPAILDDVRGAVTVIVDGIAGGLFPARPNPTPSYLYIDCPYCDPDGLGTADRRREWERKCSDPALGPYVNLCEPDRLDDGDDD